MKKVTIYTDGACSVNPGPGGWAAILIYGATQKEISGFEDNTTNNRMELKAVICALKALKQPCEVNVYTDSAYVSNAIINGWLTDWQTKGWRTAAKKEVKNIDLWQDLLTQLSLHQVTMHKVKGHSDNQFNNRCDRLAVGEIEKNRKQ